jgi:hypothetical protein
MSEDEPDIKRENLADSDESPFGDTTEHAGEQDTDEGETYHDPEGAGEDDTDRETPPGGEDGTQSASPGEGEGGEGVPTPDSERLANRTDA